MRKNTRDSGIDIIGEVPWGTHFCQFYQTKEDLMDILIPYFKAGLENNEFCIWITSPPLKVEEAKEALRKSVPDLDTYQARGQIEIIPHSHWYVNNFDSEKAMNRWFEKLDRALTNGYNGLRLTEDTSWVKKNRNDFTGFEEKLDNTLGNKQIMALYTYSLDRCSSAEIINAAFNHQLTLIKEKGKWEKVESSNRQNINNRKRAEEAPQQSEQHARMNPEGIISPDREMDNIGLADIVDARAIQSLMDDFYNFAHIAMALVDLKGNVLVSAGWQDICTRFHRVHPETCKHCVESDTKLSSGIPPGEFKLYRCRNNMWDIATPVVAGDQHVGNIFSGQFFFEDEPLDYELFRSHARKYGFNEEEYIAALEKVPRLSSMVVDTCMAFFMTLANMISKLSYSNFKLTRLLAERDVLVEALRESEEKYRNIVETANEGIWILDAEVRTTYVNKKMAEMLGYSQKEMIGRSVWDFSDEEGNAIARLNMEKKRQGIVDESLEFKLICKDGSTLWTLVNTKSSFDRDGKYSGSMSMLTDITRRKQEEYRIRRYNRILKGINQIFSSVVQAKTEEELGEACLSVALEVTGSEFGFIIEMGADGLLHDVAKSKLAWEQCLMYEKTGHVRLPRDYVIHGLYGSVIINEKSFFTNDPQSHPDSIGLPDGHPPIRSFLGVPLVQGGKTIGSIAVANREGGYSCEQQEDLEAIAPAVVQALQRKKAEKKRKQAENALQASEERYRSIYENSLDGILLTKPDGTILCANPQACQMFGTTEDEIVRVGREGILVSDEKLAAALKERRLTGRMRAELTHRRKDGSTFVCDTTSKLFVDADGSINTSLICRDISERKKTEEALQKSEVELARAQQVAQIGSWTWDLITNEVTWSEQSYRNYGLAPGEVKPSYELFISFIVPEDRERVDREIRKAVECGHKYNITYNIIRIDGTPRILLSENEIVTDESGNVVLMYGTNQDITERKKAEEALKKAYDNLEILVEERTTQLEKAYNSLKISEKGLSEAQKMAHIGNWEWDIVTGELYWSEEMYRIFRRDPQESVPSYNELLNYVHPDDRDYMDNAIKKALKGEPYSIDYRIITASGEERTVHAQSEVIFDEKNIPVREKGIVQDITERKRAEEKIQTLANAVESSNDAIVTVSLEGLITSWNKAAEQVYGYLAEEVLGKSRYVLAPPHLHEETKKLTEMVIQGEKVHQYETLRLRKDGTHINVSITLSPVFDIAGKLVAISGIVRDVTERIRAEEALRESEARLRQFYESDMIGVFYYNLDGSITDANDKFLEIVGYTREDLHAGEVNWNKMTPPEYRSLDEKRISELKNTGVKEPNYKEYIRKDVSRVPVIVGAATFDQVLNEGIAFVLDITEKKKAEEALANIEITRKKEIHHRIKNNLQVISSLLDLQADKFDNPKVIEAFRESQNRVISMALIHEELYKGEGTDALDFCEYLQELAESLFQTYSISSKNIHLKVDIKENAFFNMDIAVPLGILVNELVSNSLKHAFPDRDRGEIRIELRREENDGHKKKGNKVTSFILTVSDNGIGIPENLSIQDLDSLGIQLITALVDQLDGKFELKRNSGTEFTIRFTVAEENNQISAPALQ